MVQNLKINFFGVGIDLHKRNHLYKPCTPFCLPKARYINLINATRTPESHLVHSLQHSFLEALYKIVRILSSPIYITYLLRSSLLLLPHLHALSSYHTRARSENIPATCIRPWNGSNALAVEVLKRSEKGAPDGVVCKNAKSCAKML